MQYAEEIFHEIELRQYALDEGIEMGGVLKYGAGGSKGFLFSLSPWCVTQCPLYYLESKAERM